MNESKRQIALERLYQACLALEYSNKVWNPFAKGFVRPWTEFYAAIEAVREEQSSEQS